MRDAVLALLDGAIETLQSGQDDESVHRARRACKRVRAGLRLLRRCLGRRAYQRDNEQVRDAARPLTAVRDAFVLQRTLRTLATRPVALERRLDGAYRRERRALDRGGAQRALVQLRAVRKRWVDRPPDGSEVTSAVAGLRRVYAAGRKSLEQARDGDDARLHEWRKQTRYLLNALELIEAAFHVKFPPLRRRAQRLAEILGEDHDLGVLHAALRRHAIPERRLVSEIVARRRELQSRASRLGRRLYRHTPRYIEAHLAGRLKHPKQGRRPLTRT